jgi:hypothetical protein
MIQRSSARTIKPQFMSYVLLLQFYAEHGSPLLAQAARILYDGVIADTYAPQYKLFYTQGSSMDSASGTAIPIFQAIEQAVALRGMMTYSDSIGDPTIIGKVKEIIYGMISPDSELLDTQHFGFYSRYQERTTRYMEDEKRADANLMLYSAFVRYFKYDKNIEDFLVRFQYLIQDNVYDIDYNAIYSHYDADWTPKPVDGIYELSLSDSIMAAQIFLEEEELKRELRGTGS